MLLRKEKTMKNFLALSLVSALSLTSVAAQAVGCSELQFSRQLAPELTFDYVVSVDDATSGHGTLKGRLTLEGLAWIAIGTSTGGMTPDGEAIIGSDAGVLKYSLKGKTTLGVTPDLAQTLTDTSFVQNVTHTVMEFTKIIQENGERTISIGQNNFIWSYGSSNTLAFHAHFGIAPFALEACVPPTASPTPAPTTPAPITPVPTTPAPTTPAPTTHAPTTGAPSPTTGAPPPTPSPSPTPAPTTPAPTTPAPITPAPTTPAPTTPAPTTSAPTTPSPTPAPTTSAPTTPAPTTGAPSLSQRVVPPQNGVGADCSEFQRARQLSPSLFFEYVVNTDGDQDILSGRLTLAREAWLGFGVTASEASFMFPSNVMLGLPDEDDSPRKYSIGARSQNAIDLLSDDRQTLINSTLEQGNGQTMMTFSKILKESDEVPIDSDGANIFIFAYGTGNSFGYHAFNDRGAVRLSLSSCVPGTAPVVGDPNDGDLGGGDGYRDMWTSHGVFAGIAWGVLTPLAIASSLLRGLFPPGGIWFTVHFSLNLTSSLFTIIAFAVAVSAVDKASVGEDPNHFVGLAHRTVGLFIFLLTFFQVVGGLLRPHLPKQLDNDTLEEKSPLRFSWEVLHKFVGFGLLAMAWWQCHSGLGLFAARFSSHDLSNAFLAVTLSIAGITSLVWAYTRFFKGKWR